MAQSPAPSAPSGNRIPLYVALFVAVAALAILGLRLTRNAPTTAAQPAAAPTASPSQQPFPSNAESKPQDAPAPSGDQAPSNERLAG